MVQRKLNDPNIHATSANHTDRLPADQGDNSDKTISVAQILDLLVGEAANPTEEAALFAAGYIFVVRTDLLPPPAPPTITDDFNGTAGGAPDSTLWDVSTVNGGTVQLDGSGAVVFDTLSSVAKSAIMVRKVPFTATAQTRTVFFKAASAGADVFSICGVAQNATEPTAGNTGAGDDMFVLDIYNSAVRFYYKDNTGALTQIVANAAIAMDTEYCLMFTADATGWQVALFNTDQNGTKTTAIQALTTKINWSATQAIATQAWLIMGDRVDTAYALSGSITKYVES